MADTRRARLGLQTRLAQIGLQTRLALLSALVLGSCLTAVGVLLDRSFRATVQSGAEEQLRAAAYGLLGAVEESGERIAIDAASGEPRFSQPDSGLYAFVEEAGRGIVWRSPSALTQAGDPAPPPDIRRPAPGEFFFGAVDSEQARFALAYTVIWEALGSTEATFWVLTDQTSYQRRIAAFRRSMAIGLAAAALAFVCIQLAALRWGLRPLRRMARRIRLLEAGSRQDIGDDYPPELGGLAGNLNRFITCEHDNRERYRRAMDDLAHSLKTPLAVLRNGLREAPARDAHLLREQLERMESTVASQLSRAAAARTALPLDAVAVMPVALRIARALERAYADKGMTVDAEESALAARVDGRDLMEMLGNLIENAFKYGRSRVRLSARAAAAGRVQVRIEDDGDGIDPVMRELVLQRGARADSATAGHGIGLAASAGSDIPGTSSTLGWRRGLGPRVALSARFTGARIPLPDLVEALALGPLHEVVPFLGHQRGDLLPHGLAHDVGGAQGVACELLQY